MIRHATQQKTKIMILTGGTGRTARMVLESAFAQFPEGNFEVRVESSLRSSRKAIGLVKTAAEAGVLICHSLVVPSVRRSVTEAAERLGVPCIDILGPAIAMIGDQIGLSARGRAGLSYDVNREQFDRMDAMDFTLAHDDGMRVRDLERADIVLVGASRTTKSVTCCYLAFRGIRAANVPIIAGHEPPPELLRLNRKRVVGLTMSPSHLASIRELRVSQMGDVSIPVYTDLRKIQRELMETRSLMKKRHWHCIDVSYKATEEVAAQILELVPTERHGRKTSGS